MYVYDFRTTLENGLRSLVMAMEVCRQQQVSRAISENDQPKQDHWAECTASHIVNPGMSVKECCNYLIRLYEGVCIAEGHEDAISEKHLYDDVAVIADMIMGTTLKAYSDNLIACAREVRDVARELLHAVEYLDRTKSGCLKVLRPFMRNVIEITKRYGYDLTAEKGYSLPLGYLQSWMERRYWENQK